MNCGNYPLHSSYLGNTRENHSKALQEQQQALLYVLPYMLVLAHRAGGRLTCCSDILGTAAKEASACLSKRSFRGQHSLALQAHSDERETYVYLNFQALPSPHPISPSLCRHCCDSSSSTVLLNISAETWEFLFMWKASNTLRISDSHNPKHFALLQWTGWPSSFLRTAADEQRRAVE